MIVNNQVSYGLNLLSQYQDPQYLEEGKKKFQLWEERCSL